uniref:Uncharacterized protein n=1 Tax=Setaria viridis TaxID=4556 RepID=A0A4U6UPI9_SETVI|nr:LOW QUALITY PROTEIN: hypothetical protein SEVIR_5G348100v2 [Setaria viridis]
MRREGRQRGWVRSYVRFSGLIDPEKARHAVYVVDGASAASAPRKPTNHSRSTGGDPYKKYDRAKAEKGRHKFRHDEVKTYLRDLLQGDDGGADYE